MVFFFFSSRRRHTRFDCDWSSDVCSSDLRASGGFVVSFRRALSDPGGARSVAPGKRGPSTVMLQRSEEHTSELQSQSNLVCRLLLEKKKKIYLLKLRNTVLAPHEDAPHSI